MEEGVKNKLILALAILTAIFLIFSISSCFSSCRKKAQIGREMALRMDLEEKVSRFNQEKVKLEKSINDLNQSIAQEKKAHEATKKSLSEEKLVNKSLKEELDKVTKLKEKLEEDLKDALVTSPKKR